MSDPRERIETEQVEANVLFLDSQTVDKTAYWWIGMRDPHEGAVPWPELVELAQKILAANEAWLDSQTPTLEGLRAKYPGRSIGMARVVCGPTYCWRARVGPCESPHIVTEIAALRWLAAKLEELT